MIKKEIITKEVPVIKHLCDFCGDEVKQTYTFCSTQCYICGRDMCPKHRVDYMKPNYDNTGDYTTMICTECDKIAKPYFVKLKSLFYHYETEEDKILEEMKKVCMENANKGINNEL